MLKTVQFSLAQDQSLDSDALIENNNVYQRERKLFIDALIKNRGEAQILHEQKLRTQQHSLIVSEEEALKRTKALLMQRYADSVTDCKKKILTSVLSDIRCAMCDNPHNGTPTQIRNSEVSLAAHNACTAVVMHTVATINDKITEYVDAKRDRAMQQLNNVKVADIDTNQIKQCTASQSGNNRCLKSEMEALLHCSLISETESQALLEAVAARHLAALESMLDASNVDLSTVSRYYELHAGLQQAARRSHDLYRSNVKLSAKVAVTSLLLPQSAADDRADYQ